MKNRRLKLLTILLASTGLSITEVANGGNITNVISNRPITLSANNLSPITISEDLEFGDGCTGSTIYAAGNDICSQTGISYYATATDDYAAKTLVIENTTLNFGQYYNLFLWDAETTLVLNNATLNFDGGNIFFYEGSYTLDLSGENTIFASSDDIYELIDFDILTIKGDGILNVDNEKYAAFADDDESGSLTITENATLNIETGKEAIYLYNTGSLIIDENATLNAKSNDSRCIYMSRPKEFTNKGTITAEGNGENDIYGIVFQNGSIGGTFTNSGTITSTANATNGSAYGISFGTFDGGNGICDFNNSGTIKATVSSTSTGTSTGICFSEMRNSSNFKNTGSIEAGGYEYGLYYSKNLSNEDETTFVNDGTILAYSENSDYISDGMCIKSSDNGKITVTNNGTITATGKDATGMSDGIRLVSGYTMTDSFNNNGTIIASAGNVTEGTYNYSRGLYGDKYFDINFNAGSTIKAKGTTSAVETYNGKITISDELTVIGANEAYSASLKKYTNKSGVEYMEFCPKATNPTIQTQPKDQTVTAGSDATFSISASASDSGTLSYQWYLKENGATSGTAISNATSASYTASSVTTSDNGNKYYCVVTNTLNGTTATITSDDATLTVIPTYTITKSNVLNGSFVVKSGDSEVTKAASGTEITIVTTPDDGYEIDTISVVDANNNIITVTNSKFTMPSDAVTITVTFKLIHVHSWTKVNGQAATCTEAGWESYYTCSCGNYAEDSNGSKPISDLSAWKLGDGKINALGHNYGNPTYSWSDDECTATRSCSRCTSKVNETKQGTYVKDTNATCTEAEKGHYEVTFNDTQFGSTSTTTNSVTSTTTLALGHNITKVDGQEATCEEAGYKDYYKCDRCNKLFEDSQCSKEISDLSAWKLGDGKTLALGHTVTKVDGKKSTYEEAGYKDYYKCDRCGKLFEDETHTKEITDLTSWKAGNGNISMLTVSIVSDPIDQVVDEKGNVTFTVTVKADEGAKLSYQWYVIINSSNKVKNANGNQGGVRIEGATSSTLTIDSATMSNNGNKYYCVITSTMNGSTKTLTSNTATLTVNSLGLGAGAIVGIVLGSFFGLLLIVYLLGYFFCYREGHLDDSIIKIIYKPLPRGQKNLEEKE